VFDILAGFHRTKDWARALEEIIPKRKGVHKKDEEESDEASIDQSRDHDSMNDHSDSVNESNNNTVQ